ncbi:MAG: hypothetical protein ABWK01_01715 [Infirmifilum sp.]
MPRLCKLPSASNPSNAALPDEPYGKLGASPSRAYTDVVVRNAVTVRAPVRDDVVPLEPPRLKPQTRPPPLAVQAPHTSIIPLGFSNVKEARAEAPVGLSASPPR